MLKHHTLEMTHVKVTGRDLRQPCSTCRSPTRKPLREPRASLHLGILIHLSIKYICYCACTTFHTVLSWSQTAPSLWKDGLQHASKVAMSSRRALGGGRVLGNGKAIAPPPPPSKTPVTNLGLLSPSESSVSLSSQASSAPVSANHEDLTSRVALDEHGSAQAAAAASSRMVCPICNEEMVGIAYIGRHCDRADRGR